MQITSSARRLLPVLLLFLYPAFSSSQAKPPAPPGSAKPPTQAPPAKAPAQLQAPAADLSVTNACVAPAYAGVTCTVTIKNLGAGPSTAPIKIVDTINGAAADGYLAGAGGSLLPLTGCSPAQGGPIAPRTCTFNTSLAPGESKFFFFAFGFQHGGTIQGGSFTSNCATVTEATGSGISPDPNPANNTNICASVISPPAPAADLSVTNSCKAPPYAGVTCTVTITNVGNGPSTAPITIVDTINGAAADGYLAGAGGSLLPLTGCSPAQGGPIAPRTCTFNTSLAPGESKFFFFAFGFQHGGTVQGGSFTNNCATVTEATTSGAPDPNPANNTHICASVTP